MRNKLVALLLCVTMVAGVLTGCGNSGHVKDDSINKSSEGRSEESDLEWMNTESQLPVVKDGYEKTLRIYARNTSNYGDPYKSWFYKYLTEEFNVKLEITTYTSDNMNEFLSLAFASGNLPDIILGGEDFFTPSNLIKFGKEEGQLLDLADYIHDETIMPSLSALYKENTTWPTNITDSEGHVWSLGRINDPEALGETLRIFYNYDWLEELNLEAPTTIEEFITVMKTIKDAGLCAYPVGGTASCEPVGSVILNALGYLNYSDDPDGSDVTLRNGKVVLPYYDREAYPEYLKIMNKLYTEGLIHPDFYTLDADTSKGILSEGVGFICQAPFVYINDYTSYWGGVPMTSAYNDTHQVPPSKGAFTAGSAVVTSSCKEPELALRFLDCWYNEEIKVEYLSGNGPDMDETDILYGMTKGYDTQTNQFTDYIEHQGDYVSQNDYLEKHIKAWENCLGLCSMWEPYSRADHIAQVPDIYSEKYQKPSDARHDNTSQDPGFRYALLDTISPYYNLNAFPAYVYLDSETAVKMNNLKVAMDEYASQEIAKFVVGERALTDEELNDYFNTLSSLGADDYVKAYANSYTPVK